MGREHRALAVVFLDVDGVLNAGQWRGEHLVSPPGAPAPLDRRLLGRLRVLLRRSRAHLVLSSLWRCDGAAERALREVCMEEGIHGRLFLGQTPEIRRPAGQAVSRGLEILRWVADHRVRYGVERWVALDDLFLSRAHPGTELEPRAVWVDPSRGLQDADVEAALQLLAAPPALARPLGPTGSLAKAIVLDLDDTLIDSLPAATSVRLLGASARPAHTDADGDCIFARPGLAEFLDFCFERFAGVGIWTSASREWAETNIRHVLGNSRPWAFVWTGDRDSVRRSTRIKACILDLHDTAVKVKPLRKVWKSAARRGLGFTRQGTVIIEDSPSNCRVNYGNAIFVPPFDVVSSTRASEEADGGPGEDNVLIRLMAHLQDVILPADDVRTAARDSGLLSIKQV